MMSNLVFKDDLSPLELDTVEQLFRIRKKKPLTAWTPLALYRNFRWTQVLFKRSPGRHDHHFFKRTDCSFLLLPGRDGPAGRPSPFLHYRRVPRPVAVH